MQPWLIFFNVPHNHQPFTYYPPVVNNKTVKNCLNLFRNVLIYTVYLTQWQETVNGIENSSNLFFWIVNEIFREVNEICCGQRRSLSHYPHAMYVGR